jgi:hypothetical protein
MVMMTMMMMMPQGVKNLDNVWVGEKEGHKTARAGLKIWGKMPPVLMVPNTGGHQPPFKHRVQEAGGRLPLGEARIYDGLRRNAGRGRLKIVVMMTMILSSVELKDL